MSPAPKHCCKHSRHDQSAKAWSIHEERKGKKGKSSERMRLWVAFHSSSSTYLYIHFKHSLKANREIHFDRKKKKKHLKRNKERASSVWLLCCGVRRKMKTQWSWMPFGHIHMKIAQLCEDKGKACPGLQPSSSIWVLSSLGPGGTWAHT